MLPHFSACSAAGILCQKSLKYAYIPSGIFKVPLASLTRFSAAVRRKNLQELIGGAKKSYDMIFYVEVKLYKIKKSHQVYPFAKDYFMPVI